MELLSVIAFAVALSLDGFGVGISYGMRKIRIPALSLIVISLTSSTAIGLSMLSGHFVASYVSVETAEIIGAVILMIVGIWIVLQTSFNGRKSESDDEILEPGTGNSDGGQQQILNLRIKPFGLVVRIIREPTTADLDRSGTISAGEALMLGLALAMDALGAGFGAAMTGFKPFLTPVIVGMAKFLLVSLGVYIGSNFAANWLGARAAILPGWVLIILGIIRVIKI